MAKASKGFKKAGIKKAPDANELAFKKSLRFIVSFFSEWLSGE
jgi:hypothetical protein